MQVRAREHFSGTVSFTLVATAEEYENSDTAVAVVNIMGTYTAVVDMMELSLSSKIAQATEDTSAFVTIETASLVDTDGSRLYTRL